MNLHIIKTGSPNKTETYLDNDTYSKSLDVFCKGCIDILLEHPDKQEILLVKRKIDPLKNSYWIIGGRMQHGYDIYENIYRISKRELNIELQRDKCKLLTVMNYIWGMREQNPKTNGTTDISLTFHYKLSTDEFKTFKLDETEYDYKSIKWTSYEEMSNKNFHEAINIFSNILKRQ
jgi:hypothetical protein